MRPRREPLRAPVATPELVVFDDRNAAGPAARETHAASGVVNVCRSPPVEK
jgi:hypothetical protein